MYKPYDSTYFLESDRALPDLGGEADFNRYRTLFKITRGQDIRKTSAFASVSFLCPNYGTIRYQKSETVSEITHVN
jgi:hypothetical protein